MVLFGPALCQRIHVRCEKRSSGLLANYDIVVFDYDIGIYRYGLRYRSSVLMTTISCFSRYRESLYREIHDVVNHDIVKYTISCYTISYPISVYTDIDLVGVRYRVRYRVRYKRNQNCVFPDIVPDIVPDYIGPDIGICGHRMQISDTT